jgi:hypothetical protein
MNLDFMYLFYIILLFFEVRMDQFRASPKFVFKRTNQPLTEADWASVEEFLQRTPNLERDKIIIRELRKRNNESLSSIQIREICQNHGIFQKLYLESHCQGINVAFRRAPLHYQLLLVNWRESPHAFKMFKVERQQRVRPSTDLPEFQHD